MLGIENDAGVPTNLKTEGDVHLDQVSLEEELLSQQPEQVENDQEAQVDQQSKQTQPAEAPLDQASEIRVENNFVLNTAKLDELHDELLKEKAKRKKMERLLK